MRTRTVERVEGWDSRAFSGGFRALHELADDGFSGAIVAEGTWLFMLNGRVVGVFEGEIDDVSDASGTVYAAPDPALPLLFSMQERGGETQARYYTNDTPLSDADDTLTDANFTGFVELSENVLSGDYYVVYYGGRSMAAAFVGASEELIAGEEAFERADDEVGVYEVRKVAMNITDIPEPEEDIPAASGTAGVGATDPDAEPSQDAVSTPASDAGSAPTSTQDSDAGPATASTSTTETDGLSISQAEPEESPDPSAAAESETNPPAAEDPGSGGTSADEAVQSPDSDAAARTAANPDVAPDSDDADGSSADTQPAAPSPTSPDEAQQGGSDGTRQDRPSEATTGRSAGDGDAAAEGTPVAGEGTGDADDVFSDEQQWRKTTSVPALDPDETDPRQRGAANENTGARSGSQTERQQGRGQQPGGDSAAQTADRPRSQRQSRDETDGSSQATESSSSRRQTPSRSQQQGSTDEDAGSTRERLQRAVKDREERLEQLSSRIREVESERDDLENTVEDLRAERDHLADRVEELETDLAAASEGESTPSADDLSPADALADTNLFVRYDSKGAATLDSLVEGDADPEAVNANLRLDHHTRFEADEATVNGESYAAFLESSNAYRFVSWLVSELPYEIRDANHRAGLADLYEAIPEIDRIELQGTVDVAAEDASTTRTFDVVVRNRMGDPLVVADLNDERDPVTGDEMSGLVDSATTVGEYTESLSAAFYVTASFFEPDALEVADDATESGGLLSRSDRLSHVKVARKQGFHLCLVEDRNEAFHLTVPEL